MDIVRMGISSILLTGDVACGGAILYEEDESPTLDAKGFSLLYTRAVIVSTIFIIIHKSR
jgi:hypothetical protein